MATSLAKDVAQPVMEPLTPEQALEMYKVPSTTKVVVRFKAIGSAPILKQNFYKISASHRFQHVIKFLRETLGWRESLFTYINASFAPAPDDSLGGLYKNRSEETIELCHIAGWPSNPTWTLSESPIWPDHLNNTIRPAIGPEMSSGLEPVIASGSGEEARAIDAKAPLDGASSAGPAEIGQSNGDGVNEGRHGDGAGVEAFKLGTGEDVSGNAVDGAETNVDAVSDGSPDIQKGTVNDQADLVPHGHLNGASPPRVPHTDDDEEEEAPLLVPTEESLPPLPESTHHPDSPTLTLITSLREQITLLTDQGLALNTKLLTSLGRLSTLEDTLESTRSTSTTQVEKIATLQKEKDVWEESMSTGLLVERGTIKEEMQKLVEGLVEEERKRGSAELGRKQVEQEVDDLSATLFEQANTMVAEQRLARILAEARLKEAQENLSAAETAMRDMQTHLQSLPSLLPPHDLDHPPSASSSSQAGFDTRAATQSRRYLANHVPHSDFLNFIGHIRLTKPQHAYNLVALLPPPITTLSGQAFVARTIIEDHDPTLRMDTAPNLTWLTRRSVTQAIITGELIIEPIGVNALLASPAYVGHSGDIGCAMCGRSVFPPPAPASGLEGKPPGSPRDLPPPPAHPAAKTGTTSTSRFSLKPFFTSPIPGSTLQPASPIIGGSATHTPSPPVFIFRIAVTATNAADKDKEKEGRYYPLCATGWCLARLRTTCELWRFIRLGLVETVWKGEDGTGWAAGTKRYSAIAAGTDVKRMSVSLSVPTTPVPGSQATDGTSELKEISEEATSSGPSSLPKKRPAWGLGFRTSSGEAKQNRASGNGGWFSKGSTPPQSPATERPSSIHKVDIDSLEPGEGESAQAPEDKIADGDSLEAFDKRLADAAHNAFEEGPAVAMTAARNEEIDGARESATHAESELLPPSSGTRAAATSGRSSLDSNAGTHDFSTPLGSDTSQPPTPDPAAPPSDTALSVPPSVLKETAPLRLSSEGPRTSLDMPNRPPRRTPAPPPLPDRSRACTSLEVSVPLDPSEPPKTPDLGVETASDEHAFQPLTPDPSATPHPPVLPPRKARMSLTSAGTGLHAGQRFLEGDGWELKAWKEIVRLKEEMFRARVGVVPRDDL